MRPSLAEGGRGEGHRVACELPGDLYLPSPFPRTAASSLQRVFVRRSPPLAVPILYSY